MTQSSDWKVKMLIKAMIRLFKTGVTLLEKIEKGEEV